MQTNRTIDDRVTITQEITERMGAARKAHWKVLSDKGEDAYMEERRNLVYIIQKMAACVNVANMYLASANIYNLHSRLEQSKTAIRMARVWHAMTPYAMMDSSFGKFLMDDLAEVFQNYQIIACRTDRVDPYWKVRVTGKMFEVGTCIVRHDERDQTFTGYTVKRDDMAPLFASAVEYIAYSVDNIIINQPINSAE